MNIKNIIRSFALATVAVLGTAGVAQAACFTTGQIEQVYTNGTTTYVYVSPSNSSAVTSYVYYFTTVDPELARLIASNVHGNFRVSGSAATCPTTGSYRYGGVASYAYAG